MTIRMKTRMKSQAGNKILLIWKKQIKSGVTVLVDLSGLID